MRIPGFFFSRRTLVSLILTYLLMVVLMFLLAHRAITRIPFYTGPAGTFFLLSGLAFFLAVAGRPGRICSLGPWLEVQPSKRRNNALNCLRYRCLQRAV